MSVIATLLALTTPIVLTPIPALSNSEKTFGSQSPVELPEPSGYDSGAYITQIGSGNVARIKQSESSHYTRTKQQGSANRAIFKQQGGAQFADVTQQGDDNALNIEQQGVGANVLYLSQQGNLNGARIEQTEAGDTYNAAVVVQEGNGNDLSLTQDGSNNQAALVQDGDHNVLTATQFGDTNRLQWNQYGNGLSNLVIQQTGGSNIQLYVDPTFQGGAFYVTGHQYKNFQSKITFGSGGCTTRGIFDISLPLQAIDYNRFFNTVNTCEFSSSDFRSFRKGLFNITRYDLTNGIFSGTFEFLIKSQVCGDTIRVTDGRFDVKL